MTKATPKRSRKSGSPKKRTKKGAMIPQTPPPPPDVTLAYQTISSISVKAGHAIKLTHSVKMEGDEEIVLNLARRNMS